MAVEWVRWYFGKWHGGTKRLSLEERGAYITVCNMIYMEAATGGRLADDDKEIAYEGRMSLRTWRRLKRALIEKGKLTIEAGFLINERAAQESEHAEKLLQQRRNAGSSNRKISGSTDDDNPLETGNSRGETNKNKEIDTSTVRSVGMAGDTTDVPTASRETREEKTREEKKKREKKKREKRKEETQGPSGPLSERGSDVPALDLLNGGEIDSMVAIWNRFAEAKGLPRSRGKLDKTARGRARQRLEQCGGIEGWAVAVASVANCPHLLGDNDRAWRADFTFMLQAKSFTRLLDGGYESKPRKPKLGGL